MLLGPGQLTDLPRKPQGFYCMYSVHVTLMAAHLQLLQWHGALLRTIFAEEEAGRLRTQAQAML